jgi:hypothetical protein
MRRLMLKCGDKYLMEFGGIIGGINIPNITKPIQMHKYKESRHKYRELQRKEGLSLTRCPLNPFGYNISILLLAASIQSVAPCNGLPTSTVCRSYPETPTAVKPTQPFVGLGFEWVQTPASVMGKRAKVVGNFVHKD